MELNFKIQKDKLIAGSVLEGNSGNVGTYICNFDILDNTDFMWLCVFKKDDAAYQQVIEDGRCVIPKEVLETPGNIEIGCYGISDGLRLSTNWLTFSVKDGAYSEATAPQEITPDAWEVLVMNSVPYIGETGNWYVYDKEKKEYVDSGMSSKGEKGDKGETGNSNAIKETATGSVIVLKDIAPSTDDLIIKLKSTSLSSGEVYEMGQNVWNEQCTFDNNGSGLISDYIHVIPGADYYLYSNSPVMNSEVTDIPLFCRIMYYDVGKLEMSVPEGTTTSAQRNSKITIPSDCYYIKFQLCETYGNTYNNDICINVYDERINGTYAPYQYEQAHFYTEKEVLTIENPSYPVITLFTEDEDVILECEYSKDISKSFEKVSISVTNIKNQLAGLEDLLGGI